MSDTLNPKLKPTTQVVLFGLICLGGIVALIGNALSSQRLERKVNRIGDFYQQQPGFLELVAEVDHQFQEKWQDRGLNFAGSADTLTVMRRASLALHGTIPSLEEIQAFT